MTAAAFDTHAYIKRLTRAGMPEEQAEAQAEVLAGALVESNNHLATKKDLELLKKDLLLKLGSIMVGGFVVLSGMMISILSLLLQ